MAKEIFGYARVSMCGMPVLFFAVFDNPPYMQDFPEDCRINNNILDFLDVGWSHQIKMD